MVQQTTPRPRDYRLDFFRGVALMIIYIAHTPGNLWSAYIPARYGPSDAADMFVFLSGCAAAIAFGGAYRRSGWWIGTARISLRVWQLYLAHILLFFGLAAVCIALNYLATVDVDYARRLNLVRLFYPISPDDPALAVLDLFTLQWVPNYFDILPIYFVVLAMVPIAMLIARVDGRLVLVTSLLLWFLTWQQINGMPRDTSLEFTPWIQLPVTLDLLADRMHGESGRMWFFNPFSWQILFFIGFSFSIGWIKPPPRSVVLFWVSVAFVVLMMPIRKQGWVEGTAVQPIYDWLRWFAWKSEMGPLRVLQLLALAYIAVYVLEGRRHWLEVKALSPIIKCGQQALSVFCASMILSWVAGFFIDHWGRGALALTVINLGGMAILIGIAYTVAFYKSEPWKRRPPTGSNPVANQGTKPPIAERTAEAAQPAQ